jgi:hypothetical protein
MDRPQNDQPIIKNLRLKRGTSHKQETFSLSLCPEALQALRRSLEAFKHLLKRPSRTLITRRALAIYERYLSANRSKPSVIEQELAALTDLAKTGKLKTNTPHYK